MTRTEALNILMKMRAWREWGKEQKEEERPEMPEQKEVDEAFNVCIKLLQTSLSPNLDEAAEEYKNSHLTRAYWLEGEFIEETTPLDIAFKAGAQWREAQIPVPNNMRDAADEYSATPENKKLVDGEKYKAFVVGAEWMAELGVTAEGEIVKDINNSLAVTAKLEGLEYIGKFGDKVIVQIRRVNEKEK